MLTIKTPNQKLLEAVQKNDLTQVEFLLNNPDIKEKAFIHSLGDGALRLAASLGNMEMVDFLLTSNLLKEHADIHAHEDNALIFAAKNGHLNLVKYFLTSPKLKEHSNIKSQSSKALSEASINKHWEIVKYLLVSSELQLHCNIHANNNIALRTACINSNMSMIKFILEENFNNNDFEKFYLNDILISSIENNQKEVVLYLLTHDNTKKYIDIHFNNEAPLKKAIEAGHLDMVKILLIKNSYFENSDLSKIDANEYYSRCNDPDDSPHLKPIINWLENFNDLKQEIENLSGDILSNKKNSNNNML